jgi:hypothetical protein
VDAGGNASSTAAQCDYNTCYTCFGTADITPLDPRRDLQIVEAYEDHLDVTPRNPDPRCLERLPNKGDGGPTMMQLVACCFPSGNQYAIRTGAQWAVVGDQSPYFLHRVVPSDTSGACRNSCDPVLQRMNGRAFEVPAPTPTTPTTIPMAADQASLFEFVNPMFRFGIIQGNGLPSTCSGGATPTNKGTPSVRDMQFRFSTTGAFVPMFLNLSFDGTVQVTPMAITYLAPTKELVVTDGYLNGIIFVSLNSAAYSRSYF